MQFRETTAEDFEYCASQGISGGKFSKEGDLESHSWTLEHQGDILVVGGFFKITETTAWAWIELTQFAHTNIVETYRVVKEWMVMSAKEYGIIRYQAFIDPENQKAIRTAEHLGFYRETTMNHFFGNGKHAYQYVRLFTEDNPCSYH